MSKLHKSIVINAPQEKVWDAMLSDATYREWTEGFNPGSHFEGSWEEGEKIKFIGPNTEKPGSEGGMSSRIAVNRKPEFISIEHIGLIEDGVEITEGPEAEKWKGFENYSFNKVEGGTELVVDMDLDESALDFMSSAWDESLLKLKEIAERS